MAWALGVDGRAADGLQSPHRAPKALCGSCDAGMARGYAAGDSRDRGGARLRGRWVSCRLAVMPGTECLQPGQGSTELGFPRPAPGEMQSEAARRAGDPSHQSEDPPPEGLGDHGPLAQTNPRRPAGQVMRHHLDRQPGAVGGEAPDGMWFSPTPYLRSRMAFSTSAWRR